MASRPLRRPQPSKTAIKDELVTLIAADLAALEKAQQATMAGATHEEAKPENDKDTRALEQSYLARGQALRVVETREGLARIKAMPTAPLGKDARVVVGALVTAEDDDGTHQFLMAPFGGGSRLHGGKVQVLTPQSPLGAVLLGKQADDDAEVKLAGRVRNLAVLAVD